MQVQPYLFFNGRCEEALTFYKKAVGAETIALMRFKESPEPGMTPPCAEDKVMHAAFKIGDSMLLASDGECGAGKLPAPQGFALTIHAADEAEANRVFNALSDGGQVQMPLTKTFFSPCFGAFADRFGISWMVIVLDQTHS